jgi:hypothetical protein
LLKQHTLVIHITRRKTSPKIQRKIKKNEKKRGENTRLFKNHGAIFSNNNKLDRLEIKSNLKNIRSGISNINDNNNDDKKINK